MFRLVLYFSLVLLVGLAEAGPKTGVPKEFSQFLAGISILNSSRTLSDQQKACEFRNLVKITGIDRTQALQIIELYRESPSKWKEVYNEALLTLSEKDELNTAADSSKSIKE
ncbi:MAG TPA: hypothetical protein PLE24_14600 [Chitinispirillaceae bacterium]|jgi:hypothetical protein|nr:hypothetical protein [Chitinispirillaceae bacterium]